MKNFIYKDKRVSLLILTILVCLYTFICMTKYCFSASMVYIVDEGYMTKFETGAIISAFWAVYAVMQIVGGILADRFNPINFITFGLIGAGFANLAVFFWYDNYLATIIIWSLNAAVQCAVWPSCFKLVTSVVAPAHRSNGMLIITLATPGGTLLSYAVAALIDRWQTGFLVSAVGLLAFAVIWAILMRCTARFAEPDEAVMSASRERSAPLQGATENISFLKLALTSGLVFISIVSLLRVCSNQIQTFIPTMVNESYADVDPNVATLLSLIVLGCSAVGPVAAKPLSKVIRNEMVACTLIMGVMLPLSAVALLLGKISYWPIIAAISVMTLMSNMAWFFFSALIATKFNKWGKGATVAGLINAFAAFGTVVANLVFTFIAERFGWLEVSVTVVGIVAACVILCAVNIPIWTRFKKKL